MSWLWVMQMEVLADMLEEFDVVSLRITHVVETPFLVEDPFDEGYGYVI